MCCSLPSFQSNNLHIIDVYYLAVAHESAHQQKAALSEERLAPAVPGVWAPALPMKQKSHRERCGPFSNPNSALVQIQIEPVLSAPSR